MRGLVEVQTRNASASLLLQRSQLSDPRLTWELWVPRPFPVPTTSYQMKRFFGKKRDKTLKSPDTSTNVSAGLTGFQTDQDGSINGRHNHCCMNPGSRFHDLTADTEMSGASSQVAVQGGASESRAPSLGIDSTGSRHVCAGEFLSLRSGPILTQISGSLQNRRDRRYWSWREQLSGPIDRRVSM